MKSESGILERKNQILRSQIEEIGGLKCRLENIGKSMQFYGNQFVRIGDF